ITKIKSRAWDIDKLSKSLKLNIPKDIKGRPLIFEEYFIKTYSPQILDSLKILASYVMSITDEEVKDFYTIGLLSILEDVSKIRKHGSHYRYLDNAESVGLQKLNINVISED